MALGFDNQMGSISSLLHTRQAIAGLMKEYPVAPVSNNAVVLILPLFPSMQEATKASSAKKSPDNKDDNTINGFSASGSLAHGSLMHGFSGSDFDIVIRLTVSLLLGFRLFGQSIVQWSISLHEKYLLSFIS